MQVGTHLKFSLYGTHDFDIFLDSKFHFSPQFRGFGCEEL